MQENTMVQNPFVHSTPPQISGYDIHFATRQEESGGGDIIDYFKFRPLYYAFVLADVMGKETKAKFFAYSFIGYLRGLLYPMIMDDQEITPSMLISRLSQLVDIDPFLQDVFITILSIQFDFENHSFTYTNAGCMPTLFYDAGEKKIIELNVGGGIPAFSFSDYEQDSMICKPADVLCVCSDGVTEAKDDHNNMLGLDAIKNFLADNSHLSSIEIAKGIFRMVKTHTENQRNHDDLSVLIVKRDLA
jgi:sigma-B regulation protein RsbU (phosphoserine phosphatase)